MNASPIISLKLSCAMSNTKANISEHIKHNFESGELEEKATVRKFRTVQEI